MSECHSAISPPFAPRIASSHSNDEVSMRPLFAVTLLALLAAIPVGAEEDPSRAVQWSWQLLPRDAAPGSEAELVLVATIAPQWVVYSSDFPSGVGPLPAKLRKKAQSNIRFNDSLRSVGAHRKDRKDSAWNAEYGYFSGRAELRQKVTLPADGSPVEVTLTGQACYEADGTCHLLRQDIRIPTVVSGHSS
jgi:hypothetical protein